MDLYSPGQSINQSNQSSEAVQRANIENAAFNKSLAGQVDMLKDQQIQDNTETAGINLYKGLQSGRTFAASDYGLYGAAKGTKKVAGKVASGVAAGASDLGGKLFTKIPLAADEITAVANPTAGADLSEGIQAVYRSGARPPSPTGLGRAGAAVETSEDARSAGRAIPRAAEVVAPRITAVAGKTAVKAAPEVAEIAAKGLAKAGAKASLAGIGAGLDIYKDVQRGQKGAKGIKVFGSNWEQQVGNIGNIVGSTLEIGGALAAFTGIGIPAAAALEAVGAGISVASTGLETAGDLSQEAATDKQQVADITSQGRGNVITQKITTEAARSN